jgi:transcriptional regulator with XRE-family HTH domain
MSRHVVPQAEARIGEVLRQLRERQGLSLRTLAGRAGFSASFLSQLENGQVSPSIASLDRIAAELGVTLHFTEYLVNAPPAWVSEFGPSAA